MTRPISALDRPLPALEADLRLRTLLAKPPAGHCAAPQPAGWYEDVFDAMASAHPETCHCTPQEAS